MINLQDELTLIAGATPTKFKIYTSICKVICEHQNNMDNSNCPNIRTGIPTALAAHSPAYLYGFRLGKNAGLRGYSDVMDDCSNRLLVNLPIPNT